MKLLNSCVLLLVMLAVLNCARGNITNNIIVNSQENEPRSIGLESLGVATETYSTDSTIAQII